MTITQDQHLNIVNLGSRLLRILPVAPPSAQAEGEPGFRFLVECFDLEDPELHLVLDVTVETPSLHTIYQVVKESLGQSWECTQVWSPVEDWLSTGALLRAEVQPLEPTR